MLGARVIREAKRHENLGLRRPLIYEGAADVMGCTKGLRRSCWDCSGGATNCNDGSRLWSSGDTADIFVTRFGDVDRATSGWITPNLSNEMGQIISERRLVGFGVPWKDFLGDSLFDQSDTKKKKSNCEQNNKLLPRRLSNSIFFCLNLSLGS